VSDEDIEATARRVEPVVNAIKPLLAGKGPEVQGATLADLVAIFIASHHPDLRDDILDLHIDLVRKLVPVNERMLFPNGSPWAD
jgi:hypothetical protein